MRRWIKEEVDQEGVDQQEVDQEEVDLEEENILWWMLITLIKG